jgi:hypothetical protein
VQISYNSAADIGLRYKRSHGAGVRGISWGIGRAREVEGTYERNERLRVDVPRNLQTSIWYHREPTYRVLQERLSEVFSTQTEAILLVHTIGPNLS